MSFQSLEFLTFLPVTVVVCLWVARKDVPMAKACLATACWLFYIIGAGWEGFLCLTAGEMVTWLAVRYLMADRTAQGRRACLSLAVCWHIGVLLIFKYTGFFTGGEVSIGWTPVGLSFFTFQQLWVLKEVYTGQASLPGRFDLLWYGFFFPTVTSGPILRPGVFFPQLRSETFLRPDSQDISAALYAICVGMAKKVLLADPLGTVVSNGWALGERLSAPGAWVVILAYTLQLYLDFSGYCDIATGCARLLGIQLPANFDSPYRAISVGGFWKRWHMTLTTFLRECVYFPLGGSRGVLWRVCRNIMIVYLISGVWHGAGWTFLVWGVLHGAAQVAERLLGDRLRRIPDPVRWVLTFLFVNIAWVFFRAPSLGAAWTMLTAAVSGGMSLPLEVLTAGVLDSEVTAISTLFPVLERQLPALVLAALLGISLIVSLWPQNTIRKMEDFRPKIGSAVVCGVLFVWAVLSFSSVATFIYSNF